MDNRERKMNISKIQIIVFSLLAILFLVKTIGSIAVLITTLSNPVEEAIIMDKHEGDKYGRPFYYFDVDVDGQEYEIYVHRDMYKKMSIGDSFAVQYTGDGYDTLTKILDNVKADIFIMVVVGGIAIAGVMHMTTAKKKAKRSEEQNMN